MKTGRIRPKVPNPCGSGSTTLLPSAWLWPQLLFTAEAGSVAEMPQLECLLPGLLGQPGNVHGVVYRQVLVVPVVLDRPGSIFD
jgi:hypothetical protein